MRRAIRSCRQPKSVFLIAFGLALGVTLSMFPLDPEAQEPPQFRNEVITQIPLGHIEAGSYAFRATITMVAPHGQIPFHVHEFPGLRYMLEGALTIAWKEGHTQTFTQGSTYFEGPGANHPRASWRRAIPSTRYPRCSSSNW